MYSYASRVPADDRWAIVAYIRALAAQPERPARRRPRPRSELPNSKEDGAMSTDDLASRTPRRSPWPERVQRPALIAGGRRPRSLCVCWSAVDRPRRVLPGVPGGLPVLARDRAGVAGGADAPPPGRRRLGVRDPPAARGGDDDAPPDGPAVPADRSWACTRSTPGPTPRWSARAATLQHKARYLNVGFWSCPRGALLRDLDRPGRC